MQEWGYQNSAVPAANGVVIAFLVRLFLLSENLDYFTQAEAALISFSRMLEKAPRVCPILLNALDWFIHPMLIRTIQLQISALTDAVADCGYMPRGSIA